MAFPRIPKPGKSKAAPASHVSDHSYDPDTQRLRVTFRSGRSYNYEGVGPELVDRMAGSESVGSFLHREIIGRFPHEEILSERG